jgi:uncharacterized protein
MTQPTPETPHLTVRGEATVDVEPELVRIHISTTARGTNRRTTLEDLSNRNRHITDLLKTYPDAVETVETGALVITPELRERGRGERVRAYLGHVRTSATLTDFAVLGELATRLADLDLTRVDGLAWSLRPDSPAHRTARRQAVEAAVRRAREYAEALGASLAALLELADDNTAAPTAGHDRHLTRIAYAAAAAPDGAPAPLDLEPQRQTVHAQVTAHFTITPPDLR